MILKDKLEAVSPDDDGNKMLNSMTAKDIHQVSAISSFVQNLAFEEWQGEG